MTRICVSVWIVSGMGNSSISFAMRPSLSPTTDIRDGKCVDMIAPTPIGILEYLISGGRLLLEAAEGAGRRRSIDEAEAV